MICFPSSTQHIPRASLADVLDNGSPQTAAPVTAQRCISSKDLLQPAMWLCFPGRLYSAVSMQSCWRALSLLSPEFLNTLCSFSFFLLPSLPPFLSLSSFFSSFIFLPFFFFPFLSSFSPLSLPPSFFHSFTHSFRQPLSVHLKNVFLEYCYIQALCWALSFA